MFEYSIERYEKFDIHKDSINHNSLKGFTFTPQLVNKILTNGKMTSVPDVFGAYKYYLLRRMNNVGTWYKGDLFDFYETSVQPYTTKLLFVVNKQNGRLDNIISRVIFDDISSKINKGSDIYAIRDHAIKRASQRVPGLHGWKPFQVTEWLEKKLKKLRPCMIKPQFEIMALLNHRFEKCNYFMDTDGRVYVVKDNMLTTLHCNEADRWVRK